MQQQASADGLVDPAAAGRALAAVIRERLAPLTLGMVFPFSNHNFDLRYWLAAAGVHPDHDVRLVAIPPPLMVDSLRAGLVDGFCVGEPWNSLAEAQDLGSIVATQSQLFPRAVEKVLAVRASFAERSELLPKLLHALDAAAAWVDDASHHAELAALLALPEYLGVPQRIIAAALGGRLRLGVRRGSVHDADFMYFHRHAANAPQRADGLWAYAQMVRWGQLAPSKHAERIAADVFRPDIYRQSVRHDARVQGRRCRRSIASSSRRPTCRPISRQFEVHTPFAPARSL